MRKEASSLGSQSRKSYPSLNIQAPFHGRTQTLFQQFQITCTVLGVPYFVGSCGRFQSPQTVEVHVVSPLRSVLSGDCALSKRLPLVPLTCAVPRLGLEASLLRVIASYLCL